MSAIGGIYYRDGRPARSEDVRPMLDRPAYRGDGGSGVTARGACVLCHTPLRDTPESSLERYPIEEGELMLAASARLDNREELARILGHADLLDAALLLAAFRRWGSECPAYLLGDFAFAAWDGRRLVLARDPIGVRPLYYHLSARRCVFATHLSGVLPVPDVPRRLDAFRTAEYLSDGSDDAGRTFYRDIRRLPPGSVLVVEPDREHLHTYWRPDRGKEVRLGSDAQYAEAFRELLTDAVRVRMRTAFPKGAHLTGGLDSSSIVALARELKDPAEPLHTLTLSFPDLPRCDETRYARSVIEQGGVEPHVVDVGGENQIDDLDEVLGWFGQPVAWTSWALDRALFRTARDLGLRVVLSGISGDITLSHADGYFIELLRSLRWPALYREVMSFCRDRGFDPGMIWREDVLQPAWRTLPPMWLRRYIWGRRFEGAPFNPLIHPDLDRESGYTAFRREQEIERLALRRTLRGHHYTMMAGNAVAYGCEISDVATAAHGLRHVYPFYDRRLMEFGLGLPNDQKMRGGVTRYILREAMSDRLPEPVLKRWTKVDLSMHVSRTLVHNNLAYLKAFAEGGPAPLEGLVDHAALRRYLGEAIASAEKQPGEPVPHLGTVLRAVVLARWLDTNPVER